MQCRNIDRETLTYRLGQSLEILAPITETDTVTIPCPKCTLPLQVPLIGQPTSESDGGVGGGLVMPNLGVPCPRCELLVTRTALRCGRFLRDLGELQTTKPRFDYLAGLGKFDSSPAAGIVCSARAGTRISRAMAVSAWWVAASHKDRELYQMAGPKDILRPLPHPWDTAAFGDACDWSLEKARQAVMEYVKDSVMFTSVWEDRLLGRGIVHSQNMKAALQRMNRIYNGGHGGLTSVDLGPAIQRQAGFVGNMSEIGWLNLQRWHNSNESRFYFLQKAAARYRKPNSLPLVLTYRRFPRSHDCRPVVHAVAYPRHRPRVAHAPAQGQKVRVRRSPLRPAFRRPRRRHRRCQA